jgi:hypothetical protein
LRAIALAGLVLTAALLAGCHIPEPVAAAVPKPVPRVALRFKRVAIVEFYNRTPYTEPALQFTDALREKLAARAASTDVIVIPRSALPALGDPFAAGRIPLEVLVSIRERFLADAVIIGSIDQHNPYWKPSVHFTLKVIDTATAQFPYELSGEWDAAEERVRNEIDRYYSTNYGSDDCRFGPDLFVTSPSYFLKFVADRAAEKLAAAL